MPVLSTQNAACSGGNTSTAVTAVHYGAVKSTAAPADGLPVVAYADTMGNLELLRTIKCSDFGCGNS